MSDDDYVKRFLAARRYNLESGWKMIRTTLEWKMSNYWNLSPEGHVKDYHFPIEFYLVSTLFPYEPDKNGFMTLYVRICMHRKVPELEKFTKAFFVHVYDKVDRASGRQGIALIFDLTNAGFRNLDWDYFRFLTTFASSYSPFGVRYILVLNLPWTLNSFRKVAFQFVSDDVANVLKFVSGDEIFEFIDRENVPDYLGGTCKRNYRSVPRGAKPIEDLVERYGYSKADVERIMPVYKEPLGEAEKCLSRNDYYDAENWLEHEISQQSDSSTAQRSDLVSYESEHQILDENKNVVLDSNISVITPSAGEAILLFDDDHEKTISGWIAIRNQTNGPVAFKILCNNTNSYSVNPSHGIVKESSSVRVAISLRAGKKYLYTDRFKVVACPVRCGVMKLVEFDEVFRGRQDLVWAKLSARVSRGQKSKPVAAHSVMELRDLKENVMDIVKSVTNLHKQQQKMWFLLCFLLFLYIILIFKLLFRNQLVNVYQSFSFLPGDRVSSDLM